MSMLEVEYIEAKGTKQKGAATAVRIQSSGFCYL
jgi:hypothetical protein